MAPPRRSEPRYESDSGRAAALWRAGSTYGEIATELGISTGLVGNWLNRLRAAGEPFPDRRQRPWSEDDDLAIREGFVQGKTVDQIAADIDRTMIAVDARMTALRIRPSYDETGPQPKISVWPPSSSKAPHSATWPSPSLGLFRW